MDEYGAQMAGYSGGLGYLDMCDARDASEKELIEMAKREGINLDKYRSKPGRRRHYERFDKSR